MSARAALADFTLVPGKAERYGDEVFFREAWRDIEAMAGEQAEEIAHVHALILFKPDGIAGRATQPALELLEEQGFIPVGGAVVELDRSLTRWLWLYRFNVASIERVWLHDLINSRSPSLLVALRDELAEPSRSIPATVRLTDQKGPSRPERRRPDQLRARLGVSDRLINFMHTSDEPADLVREIGILLDPPARKAVIEQMLRGEAWPTELVEQRRALEEGVPARSFELPDALGSICRQAQELTRVSDSGKGRWSALAKLASTTQADDAAAITTLWMRLREHVDLFDPWDVISIGTWAIDHDESSVEKQTLGDAPPAMWRDSLLGVPVGLGYTDSRQGARH